jgi:hypothetical protein
VVDSSVPFRIWIRRSAHPETPFALRFEVFDGKGILRVARPGILIDPPARVSGFEDPLTADQIRASRFLHVWGGGRKRQSHILSRLEDERIAGLTVDTWFELRVDTDGGYRYLQLEGARSERRPEAAERPTEEQPKMTMRAEAFTPGVRRRSDNDEVTEVTRMPPRRREAPMSDGDDDDAANNDTLEGDKLPGRGGFANDPTRPIHLPADPPSPAVADPPPQPHPFDGATGTTVLVRLLRRELGAEKLKNEQLSARVAVLEARLKGR